MCFGCVHGNVCYILYSYLCSYYLYFATFFSKLKLVLLHWRSFPDKIQERKKRIPIYTQWLQNDERYITQVSVIDRICICNRPKPGYWQSVLSKSPQIPLNDPAKKKKKRKQQQKWKWNHFEYLRRRHFLAIVFILLSCSLFSSMWGTRIDDLSTSTCASTNEYVYCSCSSMSSPIMLKFILLFSRYNLRHMPCIFFDNSTLESGYDYYRYWWLLFVQQNRMDIILLKFANRILDFVISLR